MFHIKSMCKPIHSIIVFTFKHCVKYGANTMGYGTILLKHEFGVIDYPKQIQKRKITSL